MLLKNISAYLLLPLLLCGLIATDAWAAKGESADARLLSYYAKQLTQFDDQSFKKMMRSTENKFTTKTLILEDLNDWIEANFHSPLAAKALYLRMGIYQQQSNHSKQALLDAFYLMHLFSDSRYASSAKKHIREAMGKKNFKKSKKEIKSILRLKNSGNRTARHANLLKAMSKLNHTLSNNTLIHEYNRFMAAYRSHAKAPMVQKLLADQYTKTDKASAAFHYRNLIKLYPSSGYVPSSLVALANIQRTHSSQVQIAIANYQKVTKRYSKTSAARQAYMQLAFVYGQQLKDNDKALATWAKVVKKYPRSKESVAALQSMGKMYRNKKQYNKAVRSYRKIHTFTRNSEVGIKGLKKAALIASSDINDYRLMIDINKEMAKKYPKEDASAEALYRNAQAYDKKLNDRKKAMTTYKIIIKKYPKHKLAKKAKRQLS